MQGRALVAAKDRFGGLVLSGQHWIDGMSGKVQIRLDERDLFGLLTRPYHWNNAEIDSHFELSVISRPTPT